MPCSNVTENLQVRLDDGDRLDMYLFSKKSCGGEVGNFCKLLPYVKGMTCEEILGIRPERLLADYPAHGDVEEFIHLKHLLGLQAVLGALTGEQSGGIGQMCTLVEVYYDQNGIYAEADIAVDVLTDRIQACGTCGSCGKRDDKAAAAAVA